MTTAAGERDPVEQLAEEFLSRFRRGERPALSEFTEAYPEHAEQIRDLFPALVLLEQVGPDASGVANERTGRVTADGRPLEHIGDYRIIREIGRGGMGVVYEAEQESLGRHVAIKVLPFHAMMDPKPLARFRREARAAARLHHTNIVPVFGIGEHSGLHFYAMQFIRGQGLDEIVAELKRWRLGGSEPAARSPLDQVDGDSRRTGEIAEALVRGDFSQPPAARANGLTPTPGPLSDLKQDVADSSDAQSASTSSILAGSSNRRMSATPSNYYYRSVARIGVQVADALAYAHAQGVLHRDIKPSNLLLDASGTVWVTDFGLAKSEGTDDVTHTGDLVGTLRYMAPERFHGRSDPRSDVYSLGVSLYELLVLRPAFDATDRAHLVRQVTHEDPIRPRRVDRRVPADLETIVLKAMERDPDHRYQSAFELAEDLRRALADLPILARRVSHVEKMWRWCRRNRGIATLAASLVVVTAVGSSISSVWLRRERNVALSHLQRALGAEQETRRANEQAKLRLYDSLMTQASAGRASGITGQRLKSLDAIAEASRICRDLKLGERERLKLRNEAIACLSLVDLELNEQRPLPMRDIRNGVAFGPDVDWYARADDDWSTIVLRRMADDSELARLYGLGTPTKVPQLVVSVDGRWLAAKVCWRDEELRREKSQVLVWNLGPDGMFSELAGPGVPLGQVRPEPVLRIPAGGEFFRLDFDMSWDGSMLAVAARDDSVLLYDLEAAEPLSPLPPAGTVQSLAFHPSEPKLAIRRGLELQIVDVQSRAIERRFRQTNDAEQIAWSPDGRLLATRGEMPLGRSVRVLNLTTGDVRELEGHTAGVIRLAFNPQGDLLASTGWDGTTWLWDPRDGRGLLHSNGFAGTFSRDGQWLGIGRLGSVIGRWRVHGGNHRRSLIASERLGAVAAAISADGRAIAAVTGSSIAFWDAATVRPLKSVPPPRNHHFLTFHPTRPSLFAGSAHGLFRWPILPGVDADAPLEIGEPERMKLPVGSEPQSVALSADGQTAVVGLKWAQGRCAVVDLATGEVRVPLAPHPGAKQVAISPDGRWAAAGTMHGSGIPVWDAQSGERVVTLAGGTARVAFDSDSRYLIVGTGNEFRFWEIGRWDAPVHRIAREYFGDRAGPIALARDVPLIALALSVRTVKLFDLRTMAELAEFETPDGGTVETLAFDAAANQLVMGTDTGFIQVWNLREVGRWLADAGLSWDPPATDTDETLISPEAECEPIERPGGKAFNGEYWSGRPPLGSSRSVDRIEIDGRTEAGGGETAHDLLRVYEKGREHDEAGEPEKAELEFRKALALCNQLIAADRDNPVYYTQRASLYLRFYDYSRAIADYEEVLKHRQDDAEILNIVAWLQVSGPANVRDAAAAMPNALRAVELAPDHWMYRHTLGVVQYRLEKLDQARATLEHVSKLHPDGPSAFELFFLAMIDQRLGDSNSARESFVAALAWQEAHPELPWALAADLRSFRAEAEHVLLIR